MDKPRLEGPACHPQFAACAEELLFHTSRYYGYTEKFLAHLAGEAGFSMTGYDADRLSTQQRQVLAGLMTERPGSEVGRHVVAIVRDVIDGVGTVDERLLQRYQGLSPSLGRRYIPRHASEAAACGGAVSPVDPIQNLAVRLHIPIKVKGRRVCMPLEILGKYLDSPNPAIRANLQQAVQRLHDAGYHLVNTPYRPHKKIDWGRRRLTFRGFTRRLLLRWLHPRHGGSHPA